MKKGPFKMKGNPMKRNFGLPTDNMASPMMEKPDPNAYEKMLQGDKNAGKTLTPQQEKILGKYKSRKAKKSIARQEKKAKATLRKKGKRMLTKDLKIRTTTKAKPNKKLPTFRKGTVSISQYDKEGNKRYNLVD